MTELAPAIRRTVQALVLCAVTYAVIGAFDLATRPPFAGNHLHTAADYTFTALGFPFLVAPLLLFLALRGLHAGRDRRLGSVGFTFVAVGFAGLAVALLASLVTADERALSPLYPLASLATFVGFALYAVAIFRARVLPRGAGLALLAGWLVGGPIAPGHGFFLAQTVTCGALALGLTRSTAEHEPAVQPI
jgi:hypothetical protein